MAIIGILKDPTSDLIEYRFMAGLIAGAGHLLQTAYFDVPSTMAGFLLIVVVVAVGIEILRLFRAVLVNVMLFPWRNRINEFAARNPKAELWLGWIGVFGLGLATPWLAMQIQSGISGAELDWTWLKVGAKWLIVGSVIALIGYIFVRNFRRPAQNDKAEDETGESRTP